ncbi:MAG: hypothetical protein ACOVQW_04840, partial [Actinomycetes bacterium]
MIKALLIALFIFPTNPLVWAECLGPLNANHFMVYLHGMDTVKPSPQEMNNRKVLKNIAGKLNLRIALPRAINKCPKDANQICWGWKFTDAGVEEVLKSSDSAIEECFPKAKKVGLLGFSNGGFAVNQIVKDCRTTNFDWFISVAAGGSWNEESSRDLSKCGKIYMFAGKLDHQNFDSIKGFNIWLQKNKSDVKIIEYD